MSRSSSPGRTLVRIVATSRIIRLTRGLTVSSGNRPTSAWMSTVLSTRRVLLWAGAIFTLSSLLPPFTHDYNTLIALQFVRGLDVGEDDEILAVCVRDGEKVGIPLLDLPLPKPPPKGAEWIEAYRLWVSE